MVVVLKKKIVLIQNTFGPRFHEASWKNKHDGNLHTYRHKLTDHIHISEEMVGSANKEDAC